MSETEIILMNESGVKAYEGEHPPSVGLKAGAFADVGTIILTNQRFVYINKGGAARAAMYALGGALAARATEKKVSKAELDEVANHPGSYSIPIVNITRVETARHFGSSYLRIDNNCSNIKPSYSFILGSGLSKNEDWVAAVNSAIMTLGSQPPQTISAPPFNPVPTYTPPPPPQNFSNSTNSPSQSKPIQPKSPFTLNCPSCGTSVNSSSKFCGGCGASLESSKVVDVTQPKPKFCGNCGTQIGSTSRFCESCGSKVSN
jgi:hypothetical protein